MALTRDPASPRLRLVVVDADPRVRDSLAALVDSDDQIRVVGRAGDPSAALAIIGDRRPDIVVVDPRLPDVDRGLALVRELRARFPALGLVVMSWSDALEADCIACGADAFIPKTGAPNDIVDAIVAAGERIGRSRVGLPGSLR